MSKRIVLLLILLVTLSAWARDANPNWLEVRSPHFIVLTDASEKQGRHVADELERMRSVFHVLCPKANVDPSSPILVIAVKDKEGFRPLEPEAYLGKEKLELGGLFLTASDKNYILLRLDVERGEHPYAAIYHEYTHLLNRKALAWLPLWLNEGLAEFFENTMIHDKNAQVGQSNKYQLQYLPHRLLPLTTLFKVDASSPYYSEDHKGSVFYAESWALTHYLEITDFEAHTHRLSDYIELVNRNHDPVASAQQAFGDLNQLEKALESYVAQLRFKCLNLVTTTEVDESAFQVRAVTPSQANAMRADFMAFTGREKDARALLETALHDDPNNAAAHETMGYLEYRTGHTEAARKWYEQAVKLNSQSFLAYYYFALISMRDGGSNDAEVEASLRTAIKLNPNFPQAYDRLATFYATHHEKLDEAHLLNVHAVELDPCQLGYRMDAANTLMVAERYPDALAVLHNALGVAKTPEEVAMIQTRVTQIEDYQAARERMARANQAEVSASADDNAGHVGISPGPGETGAASAKSWAPKYPDEELRGPKHFANGLLRSVHCIPPAQIELQVEGAGKTVSLYSSNYHKIAFSAANYIPEGELHPCSDLEGKKARVQYSETSNKAIDGRVLSVELSK